MYGHKTPSGNLVFLQQKWGMNIVKNHPVYLSDTISHFVPNTQVSTRGGYPKNRRCLSLTYESNVLCTIHIIQYISVCLCAQHTNAIYTLNSLSTRTLCSVVGGRRKYANLIKFLYFLSDFKVLDYFFHL